MAAPSALGHAPPRTCASGKHPETSTFGAKDVCERVTAGYHIVGCVAQFAGGDVWWSQIMDHTTIIHWHPVPHDNRVTAEQVLYNEWKRRVERKATAAAQAEAAGDIEHLEMLLTMAEKRADAAEGKTT